MVMLTQFLVQISNYVRALLLLQEPTPNAEPKVGMMYLAECSYSKSAIGVPAAE